MKPLIHLILLALLACSTARAATVTGMVQRLTLQWSTNTTLTFSNRGTPFVNGNALIPTRPEFTKVKSNGWFSNYLAWGTNDVWVGDNARDKITVVIPQGEGTYDLWSLRTNVLFTTSNAPSIVRVLYGAGSAVVTSNGVGDYTVSNSASAGGGSLALSTNNTFLGSTGIVRLEFTNSATINTGASYSNAGIAYLSFDLNPQATNAIGTNLLSWLNSNSNRTWVADNHFTNWTAAVSNLAQTKAVTNNPTTGGNFNHYGDMFVDGELEGNAVTVNQGALSLQYGTTDRVLGLFPNTMVSNTAVTISMLEGFSPADIGLTNLVATKIDTNNGTGFNLTVRSNSASAGAALIANGNVGINNPTPSAWLDISNMVGATIRSLFHAGTNAQNGLTVTTNGNVGIGTNAPSAAFHVGNGGVAQFDTRINTFDFRAGADVNIYGSLANAVAAQVSDRRVMLGSSTLGLALSGDYSIFFSANNAGSGDAFGSRDTRLYRASAGTVGTTNLYASGNVGIGTNSPTRKLHIHAANGTNVMAVGGLAAGVPADAATVSSWLPIEVNGTNFYLPLYK